jgi:phosphatidylglycerol lysyltransferase
LLLWNLLQPAHPEPAVANDEDLNRARKIIGQSDLTLSNAALTGDKRLLFNETGDAFVMYQVTGRSWIALGDPVGPRAKAEELVWKFRELSDRHGGRTVFYQARGDRLPQYIDLGLAALKIGEEARVPLQDFSLEGSARAELRQAHRRAARGGATFEIVPVEQVPALLPALRKISDAWLADKSTAEKRFSVGAFTESYIRQFPIALVRSEGSPSAFANLWPTGTKDELSIDLMRFGPDAPRGAMDYLFIELMLWGRTQGYRWFNLGMAPLSGLERHPLAPAWHRVGNFVFRHGEHFYNFEGLRRYKGKFDPVWEPRYLVAPGGVALPRILVDVSVLIAGGMKELFAR